MNLFLDAARDARLVYEEWLRRMTDEEKIRVCQWLTREAQRVGFDAMRERYPELSDHDIWLKLAVERLGADVVRKVYGRVP